MGSVAENGAWAGFCSNGTALEYQAFTALASPHAITGMTSLVVATACLVFALTSGCADTSILARAQSGDPEAQLQLFLRIPTIPRSKFGSVRQPFWESPKHVRC